MEKVASPLSLFSYACAYLGATVVGITIVLNTPSIILCAQNKEIVDFGVGIRTQQVLLADDKAMFACVLKNNFELYSAGSRVVHFVQGHSSEIMIYGLFFILSSLGLAIFIRSLGFLLTWK